MGARSIIRVGMVVGLLLAGCREKEHQRPAPLVYEGKPLDYWMEQLKSPDADTRVTACSALRLMPGKPVAAVPALIEALKDKVPLVRSTAIAALAHVGPQAKDAVPALTALLDDEEWSVRDVAKTALAIIEGNAPPEKPHHRHG